MADRCDYYLEQLLTSGELDLGFDGLENATWNLGMDIGFTGVVNGLVVGESAPTALSVDVTLGLAYDQGGKRINVPANQEDFDVSHDENGVPTEVVGVGNERWLAVFVEFDRNLYDPRIDGASQQVYFRRDESFKLVLRQGAEAASGAGVKVALDENLVLLADVLLVYGQTAVVNADIDTTRRQDFSIFRDDQIPLDDSAYSGDPYITTPGTIQSALLELSSAVEDRAQDLTTFQSVLAEIDSTPGTDEIGARYHAGTGTFTPDAGPLTDTLQEICSAIRNMGLFGVFAGTTHADVNLTDGSTFFVDFGSSDVPRHVSTITDTATGVKTNIVTSPIYLLASGNYGVAVINNSGVTIGQISVTPYYSYADYPGN